MALDKEKTIYLGWLLRMFDELQNKGIKFDYVSLGNMIGIPVIPTIASKGKGVDELFDKLIDVYEENDPTVRHIHINYGTLIEKEIKIIQDEIWKNPEITDALSSRYVAIKLLEGDKSTLKQLEIYENYEKIKQTSLSCVSRLEKEYGETAETIITDAKYGFIDGALKETYAEPKKDKRKSKRDLDNILTHKFWGFPIFFFFMYQKSLNMGTEFLIPSYRLFDYGLYAIASKTIDKLYINGGIRFDQRHINSDALYLNDDALSNASDPGASERFRAFSKNFQGASGSIGLSYKISETLNTKINFSSGFRAPNISELSANGVHEGTIRYELGNLNLKQENSFQVDYELSYNTKHISASVNLFSNIISNYIFSRKLNNTQGGDSIIDGYDCFVFDSGKARLFGGEFSLDIHPHPLDWLHIENNFSYVNSQITNQPDSMTTLSDEQKICISLFYYEEQSYADISESTGYETGKVKSYIQNGKRNLKICILKVLDKNWKR